MSKYGECFLTEVRGWQKRLVVEEMAISVGLKVYTELICRVFSLGRGHQKMLEHLKGPIRI